MIFEHSPFVLWAILDRNVIEEAALFSDGGRGHGMLMNVPAIIARKYPMIQSQYKSKGSSGVVFNIRGPELLETTTHHTNLAELTHALENLKIDENTASCYQH